MRAVKRWPVLLDAVVLFGAIATLPLVGAWLADDPALGRLRQFQPVLDIAVGYPRWSWWWAAAVLAPFAAILIAWLRPNRAKRDPANVVHPPRGQFPPWGWVAAAWTVLWWLLAWTRFGWFASAQGFTFLPLWLGFIVTINAATARRTGTCLLTRSPGAWLALFAVSAAFWWGFEWLNRFVRNWHYWGVRDFGPGTYALHATACFSTVLPAVAAVRELLGTCPHLQRSWRNGPRLPSVPRTVAVPALLAFAFVALLLTGSHPQQSYPALWLAPLALGLARQLARGETGFWTGLPDGDWSPALSWAWAAMICGWFWEMWNFHSAAKWIYTIPYADRWHVFEMPLLGYLGYFAFGLECGLIAESLVPRSAAPLCLVRPAPPRTVAPADSPKRSAQSA